jgi:hypothetical protein
VWYLTERIETPFSPFNFFLGGGGESSVSVLLCLTLADEAGFRGMLKLSVAVAIAVVMSREDILQARDPIVNIIIYLITILRPKNMPNR